VRPADWTNPRPADRYYLAVVGAGTGGLVSASIAAALGASVALVERDRMGGDCLNVGCVPSKAVLRAARSWSEARSSAGRFGGPVVTGEGDFGAAMRRMREVRAAMSGIDGARRFSEMGVDVFFGDAEFADRASLLVDGAVRLRFRRAIVATGARPAIPRIPGLEEAGYLTNETVFDLEELPARLIVLGAGPIGCELGQAFARFGCEVTLVDREDGVLPGEDRAAAAIVHQALAEDGVRFVGGADIAGVTRAGGELRMVCRSGRAERRLAADALLVAAGRAANVDLGLDAAGIEFDDRGILVGDRLRTTHRRVFAVGDVVSEGKFTHVADAHARMAVRNALFFGRERVGDLVIPRVTYTSPELAQVGISSAEIDERDIAADSYRVSLQDVDRARLDGEGDGFLTIHVRKGGDEILGATVVSEHAGELLAPASVAMKVGVGLAAIGDVVFPYPTVSEAWRKASDAHRRRKLTPFVRRAIEVYLGIVRRLS